MTDDRGEPRPDAEHRRAPALDRLATVALLVALVPIPLLGVGHPITHLLVVVVVGSFGWLLIRPDRSPERAAQALDLGWPGVRRGWTWVAIAGVLSGVLRWLLDERLLGGQGGLKFYDLLLRQYGVIGADAEVRWRLLVIYVPILLLVILIDGVFFSGLIQRRIAAHTNLHVGVQVQAFLFALSHTFAGPAPDIAYGVGTFIGGVTYGYLYRVFKNHWIPASLLWLHVTVVWVIMLWRLGHGNAP